MLLADPGTERTRVLETLQAAPDVRGDDRLENRFWLKTPHGEAQINIGTKDPVESVHVEFELGNPPLMDASTRRALELADALDMRVEDVQWGHEITTASLPELRKYWSTLGQRPTEAVPASRRPWWRPW